MFYNNILYNFIFKKFRNEKHFLQSDNSAILAVLTILIVLGQKQGS